MCRKVPSRSLVEFLTPINKHTKNSYVNVTKTSSCECRLTGSAVDIVCWGGKALAKVRVPYIHTHTYYVDTQPVPPILNCASTRKSPSGNLCSKELDRRRRAMMGKKNFPAARDKTEQQQFFSQISQVHTKVAPSGGPKPVLLVLANPRVTNFSKC